MNIQSILEMIDGRLLTAFLRCGVYIFLIDGWVEVKLSVEVLNDLIAQKKAMVFVARHKEKLQ